MTRRFAVALGCALSCLAPASALADSRHPLDPLSWQEQWAVLEILLAAGKVDEDTTFNRIALKPPAKDGVWPFKPGMAISRQAEIYGRQGKQVFEAVVDLHRKGVATWKEVNGVQAAFLEKDFKPDLVDELKKRPEFLEALRKRGIEHPLFVDCTALPLRYLGEQEYVNRRIAMLLCRSAQGVRNDWPRGVEGVAVTVDMDSKEILEIVDESTVPVPRTNADYDDEAIGPLRTFPSPIEIRQPLGPGFKIDGHVVSWDQWRFHLRSDARVGTIISTVTWRDGDTDRPVLYEGNLSEIFVPYMDPARNWYTRTFLDAGEYSAGGLANTLTPGIDCPDNAVFFNGIVIEDNGRPKDKPRIACLFERYAGDVNWRHDQDGRPKRELVSRWTALLGNYDYVVDWIFESDGQMRVAIGATGIVEAKMAKAKNASDTSNGGLREDAHGRFVDQHVVAVNHDHFFSFRLDLDVDGMRNSFIRDLIKEERLAAGHPRGSIWVTQQKLAKTEHDARLHSDMMEPSLWRVTSEGRKNAVGYPTSYQLMPGMSAGPVTRDDYTLKRAGFTSQALWVTPYRADERYAAGDYPTRSLSGKGLPEWTAANRPIENADLVLWYTIGMHHVPRAEDWPVMPVLWHDFRLRPFDFFDRNPALNTSRKP
jgi:primary-amine oxidase